MRFPLLFFPHFCFILWSLEHIFISTFILQFEMALSYSHDVYGLIQHKRWSHTVVHWVDIACLLELFYRKFLLIIHPSPNKCTHIIRRWIILLFVLLIIVWKSKKVKKNYNSDKLWSFTLFYMKLLKWDTYLGTKFNCQLLYSLGEGKNI